MAKARDFLNNNSALVTILAVVVLVISLGVIIMQTRGRGPMGPIDLYFYDLKTGKLFIAKSDQIPPIDAPGGPLETPQGPKPAGVRAHVFACGECPSLDGMTADQVAQTGAYIAYLEMYTEQAKQMMTQAAQAAQGGGQAAPPPMMMDPTEQTLVKRVEDTSWQQMYSQPGYMLADQAVKDCPDGTPAKACRPD